MESTNNAVYRLLTGGDLMKSVSNAFKLSCDNDIDLNNPYATSGSDPLSNNGSANPYTNLQTERKYYEPDKDVSDYNNQK